MHIISLQLFYTNDTHCIILFIKFHYRYTWTRWVSKYKKYKSIKNTPITLIEPGLSQKPYKYYLISNCNDQKNSVLCQEWHKSPIISVKDWWRAGQTASGFFHQILFCVLLMLRCFLFVCLFLVWKHCNSLLFWPFLANQCSKLYFFI